MEWEIQTIPADKTLVGPHGKIMPLCNDCIQSECSHPIKDMTLSIMGKPTKVRLLVVHELIRQVISCNGHIGRSINASVSKPTRRTEEINPQTNHLAGDMLRDEKTDNQ